MDTIDQNSEQPLSYFDLTQKFGYYVEAHLKGTEPQTAGNYGVVHIPKWGCEVLTANVVWGTASVDACTLQLERLTGTTAAGSGNNIFLSAIDLTKTANTIYTKEFLDFDRTNKYAQVKSGVRLGWKIASGSTAQLKDLHITVYFKLLQRGHFR